MICTLQSVCDFMDETLRTLLGIGSAAFVAKRAVFPTGTEKQVKMKVVCSVHVCVNACECVYISYCSSHGKILIWKQCSVKEYLT